MGRAGGASAHRMPARGKLRIVSAVSTPRAPLCVSLRTTHGHRNDSTYVRRSGDRPGVAGVQQRREIAFAALGAGPPSICAATDSSYVGRSTCRKTPSGTAPVESHVTRDECEGEGRLLVRRIVHQHAGVTRRARLGGAVGSRSGSPAHPRSPARLRGGRAGSPSRRERVRTRRRCRCCSSGGSRRTRRPGVPRPRAGSRRAPCGRCRSPARRTSPPRRSRSRAG